MIADIAFDLPLRRTLTYALPEGLSVSPGQRVLAPLHGSLRLGTVVVLRAGDASGLLNVAAPAEPVPVASRTALRLCAWAAEESLSSLGSTLAGLLPPPLRTERATVAPPPPTRSAEPAPLELWTGPDRRRRLVGHLAEVSGSALVLAPDVAAASRWARRLQAPRLDSGAARGSRRDAWFAAARGRARSVVGTRSALLVPLPPPATLALLDEHDPAHKPPGPPRIHSRDFLRQRALLEGSRLLLLSGAPSCEAWRLAALGSLRLRGDDRGPWPEVLTADTRGILRNHPLTLPLTRGIEEAARRGRRSALIVSRLAAGIACGECGAVLRCADCGIALSHQRGATVASCRLCGRAEPVPSTCVVCGGRRLSPFGWSAERVEAAVARRFPRLRVRRADGRPAEAERIDPEAEVVIGTAGLLRSLPPRSVGCLGFIAVDALLRRPDFRAAERVYQSLWTAAEAVGPGGRLVVQTAHPDHHAVSAVRDQDRSGFYGAELESRRALGYPPFRRLCLMLVGGREAAASRSLAEECAAAVRGLPGVHAYPPVAVGGPGARRPRWSVVIKGPDELPRLLAEPLRAWLERGRRTSGMVEVDMDPVAFP